MDINKTLAEEFKLRQEQIDNTVALLDDDKTIPFIARYRKELTGSLDDQVLREIADRLTYLRNLEKRKGENDRRDNVCYRKCKDPCGGGGYLQTFQAEA